MTSVIKKTIFWDIGNVLIQSVHKPLFNHLLQSQKSQSPADQLHSKFSEIIDDSFYGKINLKETWDNLQQIFGIDNNKLDIIKSDIEKNNYNQKLVDKLCQLKEKYNLGIISDLSQIGYYVAIKNIGKFLQICNKELIFISTESSLTKRKEGDRLFSIITSKINISPGNTLFIDDNLKNIELANSFGMIGILYERNEDEISWDSNKNLYYKLQNVRINL